MLCGGRAVTTINTVCGTLPSVARVLLSLVTADQGVRLSKTHSFRCPSLSKSHSITVGVSLSWAEHRRHTEGPHLQGSQASFVPLGREVLPAGFHFLSLTKHALSPNFSRVKLRYSLFRKSTYAVGDICFIFRVPWLFRRSYRSQL